MDSTIVKFIFITFSLLTVYSQDIKDTTAQLGTEITLRCATGAAPFDWWFQASSADAVQQVCMNGVVVVNYRDRFSVNPSKPDELRITSVKHVDAGLYTCVEKAGLGPERNVVQLIVDADETNTYSDKPDDQAGTAAPNGTDAVANEGLSNIAGIVVGVIIAIIVIAIVVAIVIYVVKQRYANEEVSARKLFSDLNVFLGLRHGQPTETKRDEQESLNRTRDLEAEQEQRRTNNGSFVQFARNVFTDLKGKIGLGQPAENIRNANNAPTNADVENGTTSSKVPNVAVVVPQRQKKTTKQDVPVKPKVQAPRWKNVARVRREFAPKSAVEPTINEFLVPLYIKFVLSKSLVPMAVKLLNKTPRADVKAVVALCSVCQMWRSFVTNQKRNKRTLRSYMNDVCSPYRWTVSRPTSCLNLSSPVVGVAHLNNRLYVACESSRVIHLFDATHPYSVLSTPIIKLKPTTRISDIVAWEQNKAVFVGDLENKILLQIKENGESGNWFMTHTTACSLSTYENKLMIVTEKKALKIYDTEKKLLYRVLLSDNVDPYHAVLVAINAPVLSVCVCLTQGDELTPVSEVTPSKHLAVSFTSVKRPFHAAFDYKFRGFWCYKDQKAVFIASENKNRMLLNNEYGGLSEPGKVCFVENSRGDLLVCDGCQVKVFQVRLRDKKYVVSTTTEPVKKPAKAAKKRK